MITLSKVKSVIIENGQRILKVIQFGPKTAKEISPFGFDSAAPEGMTAIFAETSNSDEAVIIGYIQRDRVCAPGASRLFSIDPNTGLFKAEIYLKNDGKMILNGGTNKAVLFEPLDQDLQKLKNDINTEFLKVQTAITSIGGTYVNAPINIDLSDCKSENIYLK
jgi:hypothetical protein